MIARPPNQPHRTRSHAPPQRLMRIVADTNTLVSGFGWGGPPGQVVDAVLSGQVTLVTSPALLGKLARVLEAAAAGRADLIVTGDKAMQELGSFQGIPI